MLTSRTAELEKRDRLNAKGIDGGSFIPRAILITGTLGVVSTNIQLPDYINLDNILTAKLMFYAGGMSGSYSNGDWLISEYAVVSGGSHTYSMEYKESTNEIITINQRNTGMAGQKFRLTVFYKG